MAKVPPGFRFHPTDVELVLYYLKRKVLGKPLHVQAITELDLYKFSPWDLPGKSCMRSGDREWFFFCPRDRKYANGPRLNRASAVGYWKTTGRDRAICNDSQTVGMKRTLIFHLGRAPKGDRTNWVMHEYRLEIKDLADTGIQQDSYVLCKIFEKSGAGPRNGEQYGAPFREEEWEDDVVNNSLGPLPLIRSGSPSTVLDNEKSTVTENSSVIPAKTREPLAPLAPVDSGSPSTALDNEKITVTENTNVIPGKTCGPLDPLEPPCQNTSYDEKSVLLTGKTCEPLEPPCQNESYDDKSAPLPGKTCEPLEPPCQSEPYDDKGTLLPGNTCEPLEPPCQSAAYDDKSALLAGKTCEPLEPLCQSASYDVESTLLPGKTCDSLELPSQNASYCENSTLILGKTCKPLELSSQNASSDENSTLIPGKTCKSLELSSQNESSDENSTLIPGNACESYRSKKRKTCESLELPSQIASYNKNSTPIPGKTCESLEPPRKKASYDEMFMENQSLIMENLEAARVLIGLSGKTGFSKQIEVASGVSNYNEVDTAEIKAEDLGVMSQNYVRTRNHCGEGEENIGRVSVRGSSIFDRNVDRGGAGGLCCSIKQMVGTDHYNSNFSGGTGTGVQDVASRGERALIQTCDVSCSAREGRQRSMDPKAVSRNGLDKGGPLATRSTEQVIYHGVPKLEVLLALGGQSSSLRRKRKKQNQSSMRVYHRKSRAEHEENDRPKLKSVMMDASLNGDMSDSERNWAEDKNNITEQEQATERQVMRS